MIELAEKRPHLKHADLGKHFGCARSTVTTILSNKAQWLQEAKDSTDLAAQKRRKAQWPLMEKALIAWIEDANVHNIAVSDLLTKIKAREFYARLYPKDEDGIASSTGNNDNRVDKGSSENSETILSDQDGIPLIADGDFANRETNDDNDDNHDEEGFTATDGWLSRFKDRYGLKSYRLHGEAASVDVGSIPAAIEQLQAKLDGYHPNDIFNADETGLFFRMLPNQTLATGRQKGIKSDKTRVTVLLAANATGTQKLKPLVIGTATQPR